MKNLKVFIYLFIATGLVLVSCSKDSNKELEASVNESTQLITATDAQQAPDLAKIEAELLNFNKTAAFKESAKTETAASRNALPSRVQTTIAREYPNASMLSYEERPIRPNSAYKHYAVFLDNGMEVVVFQWGHLLANATIEKQKMELKCEFEISIRRSEAEKLQSALSESRFINWKNCNSLQRRNCCRCLYLDYRINIFIVQKFKLLLD